MVSLLTAALPEMGELKIGTTSKVGGSQAMETESKRRRGQLTALLVTVALTSAGCSMNPATGKRQLALMSEAQEIAMGREADGQVAGQMGLYPDPGLQRYVQELGSSLAAKSERPQLPWKFQVVDDPVVNAFALPGGFIYVTRGILAHFGSEAELVSVLGHEIGHVTARHGVEQMSQQQLATLGLGVAMIASEEVRQYGQIAQAGMGLMFLKFGRDDERQADDLGLRYLSRSGFDPDEMPQVFRTLDRVSQASGAGRIPNWLSTHPAPEDRAQRLGQAIAALPPEARAGTVNRDSYVDRLAGLTFGDNPREGYFRANVFYHPEMAFKLTFPAGWKTVNQKLAVGAVSPQQDAMVVLTLADAGTAEEALRKFFSQEGVARGDALASNFYAYSVADPALQPPNEDLEMRGIIGFVEHEGQVLQLRGITKAPVWGGYRQVVRQAVASFERLTDARILNVQPKRLEVVRLPQAMTFAQFLERYPSTLEAQRVAILNGVEVGSHLDAGRRMKRIVGADPP